MARDTDSPSQSDIELDPFAILDLNVGLGVVVTHSGSMTFDAASQLLTEELERYDWRSFLSERRRQMRHFAAELFVGMSRIGAIASLQAEIDLPRARAIWREKVPAEVGILRMLAKSDEAEELVYQSHLANVRALSADARIGYLLENGDEMLAWGDARVQLVACDD
jgi:hypothetical protein